MFIIFFFLGTTFYAFNNSKNYFIFFFRRSTLSILTFNISLYNIPTSNTIFLKKKNNINNSLN